MPQQKRGKGGKFTAKSSSKREVRSVRMTDGVWQRFNDLASAQNCTTADLIEQWVLNSPATTAPPDLTQLIDELINDPTVTRNGKDRGSVRRALEALINRLSSV